MVVMKREEGTREREEARFKTVKKYIIVLTFGRRPAMAGVIKKPVWC